MSNTDTVLNIKQFMPILKLASKLFQHVVCMEGYLKQWKKLFYSESCLDIVLFTGATGYLSIRWNYYVTFLKTLQIISIVHKCCNIR